MIFLTILDTVNLLLSLLKQIKLFFVTILFILDGIEVKDCASILYLSFLLLEYLKYKINMNKYLK